MFKLGFFYRSVAVQISYVIDFLYNIYILNDDHENGRVSVHEDN